MKLQKDELIGKTCQVQSFVGTIIDETKNMITIRSSNQTKHFIKKNNEFKINEKRIKGSDLIARPQDRIKKKFR